LFGTLGSFDVLFLLGFAFFSTENLNHQYKNLHICQETLTKLYHLAGQETLTKTFLTEKSKL